MSFTKSVSRSDSRLMIAASWPSFLPILPRQIFNFFGVSLIRGQRGSEVMGNISQKFRRERSSLARLCAARCNVSDNHLFITKPFFKYNIISAICHFFCLHGKAAIGFANRRAKKIGKCGANQEEQPRNDQQNCSQNLIVDCTAPTGVLIYRIKGFSYQKSFSHKSNLCYLHQIQAHRKWCHLCFPKFLQE